MKSSFEEAVKFWNGSKLHPDDRKIALNELGWTFEELVLQHMLNQLKNAPLTDDETEEG